MQILIKSLQFLFLFFLISFFSLHLQAQNTDFKLDNSYNNLLWNDFVKKVEQQTKYRFFYLPDSLDAFKVEFSEFDIDFSQQLNEILKSRKAYATIDKRQNIVVTFDKRINSTLPDGFSNIKEKSIENEFENENQTVENYLNTTNSFVNKEVSVGRKNADTKTDAVISGFVKSKNDGSPIIGGVVQVNETGDVAATDNEGFYSLKLKKGTYNFTISSLESKKEQVKVNVYSDGRLDLSLELKLIALDEVLVSSEKDHVVTGTQMGFQKLDTKKIKEIPLVMGEKDILKVSLLLPGVQSIGEGSSGFNVRGGTGDQNLFLINQIPVYNSAHLLGFFSAFNSDAIKNFSIYSSSIPTWYGGRLSSIFDVNVKQGNTNNFSANGGISPITTRLMVEGPIVKDKSAFLVSLRTTYSDWILKQIDNLEIQNSKAQFADLVNHFHFNLNNNHKISLFSYHSFDKINLLSQNKYNYFNNGASLSWDYLIKSKHKLETSLVYAQYDFDEENTELQAIAYTDNFQLKHTEFKSNFTFRPDNNKHTINIGFNSILYNLNQGTLLPFGENSIIAPVSMGEEKAIETGIFASHEWNVSPVFTLTSGIRYNQYFFLGAYEARFYESEIVRLPENLTETKFFDKNKVVKSYQAPDFRFSARYLVTPSISLKASYNQMHQYLFLLSTTVAIAPTDKWKLADNNIKPMNGEQLSFGVYAAKGKYEFSVESYLKKINNLVEYKDGANLLLNNTPETDILQGKLNSFGVELMIKKISGRLNGWVNYTYSRAKVLVASEIPEANINFGKEYPSNYDKPHAVNLVANYQFSRRLSLSSNLVYSTGRPITYPVGIFNMGNRQVPLYSLRNEYRTPDYFRVDVSLKLEGNLAAKKLAHGTWFLSVYNLTGRKNAYSIYFEVEEGVMQAYKLSIFGAPIFSLTYSIKLGNYAN